MRHFICIIISAVLAAGCSIDNYEKPSLVLSGKILDAGNNQLVESGGINGGSVVKVYENNSTQPFINRTFPDGSFTNSKMFPGIYNYTAEGPFRLNNADLQNITINDDTEVEIKVVPYVRLAASLVELSGTTAQIRVSYEKVDTGDVLVNLAMVHSTYPDPNIFSSAGGAATIENVEAMNLSTGEKIFTISDLQPGTKYYVRAGANVVNPGNYYNYSTQVEIDVP